MGRKRMGSAARAENEPGDGSLSILNVGAGDLKLRFNKGSKEEVERARAVITDMLKRGYSIFVEGKDGVYKRVEKFSTKTDCYVIGDDAKPASSGKRAKSTVSVPMRRTKAMAVAPRAGG